MTLHQIFIQVHIVSSHLRDPYWLTFEVQARGDLLQNSSTIKFYQKIVFSDQTLYPFDYRKGSFKAFDQGKYILFRLPSHTILILDLHFYTGLGLISSSGSGFLGT